MTTVSTNRKASGFRMNVGKTSISALPPATLCSAGHHLHPGAGRYQAKASGPCTALEQKQRQLAGRSVRGQHLVQVRRRHQQPAPDCKVKRLGYKLGDMKEL